ncbi:MAG: RimK family alpha-L-glutamate ligase, partial [Acidilobaceae archaeon]
MVGIAIVYDIARWEERALIEAIRARGLKPQIIHVESTNFTIGEGLDSSIDIVLQRSLSHSIALTSTILLESSGLEVVNNSRSIAIAQDKVWALSLLSRSGIPAPKTIVSFSEVKALEAANMLGYPVVIKPINGSWGRLVSLAPDEETLRIILEHRLYTRNPYMKVHLIQEYVRKPGRDIRV